MNPPLPPVQKPTFPKQDPATPGFWDARFDAAFTPWDQGGVPQSLLNHVAQHPSPRKVLIPGCGSAHEVLFFADHGWDVTAIDFSPAAVLHAKQRLGKSGSLVREADFFGDAISREGFEVIYERAFLCALPRRLWAAWATRIAQIIPAGGCLIGFFFFDNNEYGPPFGIGRAELADLLSPHFALTEDLTPTDSIAIFAGKERWQVWTRLG
ncbi:MAG: TPMT family class I SAM-dependent methyltransferase [Burkholderiales bacterium]|nr:TPMT family class I SAM-dependent methyltransferase [Burkholderiales bacterium]